jgi:O-antigen/teichoic acid export membrane protein
MFKTNNLFVKNFSIYFLGLAISGLISFMTIPLIVRNFGIEKYGIFSLVQMLFLFLFRLGRMVKSMYFAI